MTKYHNQAKSTQPPTTREPLQSRKILVVNKRPSGSLNHLRYGEGGGGGQNNPV